MDVLHCVRWDVMPFGPEFRGFLTIDVGVYGGRFKSRQFLTFQVYDECLLTKWDVGVCGALFLLHEFLCVFVHSDVQLTPPVYLFEGFVVLLARVVLMSFDMSSCDGDWE